MTRLIPIISMIGPMGTMARAKPQNAVPTIQPACVASGLQELKRLQQELYNWHLKEVISLCFLYD
jgi:hypothetical protein